jgi:hypothetical protein
MNLFLLPETETREDGAGPVIETPSATAVVTLGITQALEREGLQVSIWGSADGESWGAKPLIEFPAKSYCGRYSIPLNFSEFPGVKQIRAAWKMRSLKKNEERETFFGFYIEMVIAEPARARAAGAGA